MSKNRKEINHLSSFLLLGRERLVGGDANKKNANKKKPLRKARWRGRQQGKKSAILRKARWRGRQQEKKGICISSLEAYNIAVVAEAIIKAAMKRSENKGTHFKLNQVELVI